MAGKVLHVELSVAARVHASFDVPPGITVLYGPSGAGKSTCLLAIAGLLRPDSGRISLGDHVLTGVQENVHVPPHLRHVALVFQSVGLFPHMSVMQNVLYPLQSRTHGGAASDPRARRQQALHWLGRTKVAHLADRRPGTLSGGEAQRVALARALASAPRVLLLDEPFSALDFPLRRELGQELQQLVKDLNIPTLLVTHDREDAASLGSSMVALVEGRVTAAGTPGEVLASALP